MRNLKHLPASERYVSTGFCYSEGNIIYSWAVHTRAASLFGELDSIFYPKLDSGCDFHRGVLHHFDFLAI